jgi:general secretion pathway protein K
VAVSAIDESGKIDLNGAPEPLLKGLLLTAGGLDEPGAAQVMDAIGDWKDLDDLRRPSGAEAADYKAAGSPYLPANGPFETVPELQRVLGMTPALYAKLAGNLTVHSRQAGVNPAYASAATLLAFPGATPDIVDTYIARRRDALAAKLPPPPFPLSGFASGPVNVWRIRAEVTTGDGVSFVREAVVRPGYQQRLMTVLEWQEGEGKILRTAAEEQNGLKVDGTRTQ